MAAGVCITLSAFAAASCNFDETLAEVAMRPSDATPAGPGLMKAELTAEVSPWPPKLPTSRVAAFRSTSNSVGTSPR